MTPLSVVFLTIIAVACILGVYCKQFQDNWAQLLGMSSIFLWATVRIWQQLIEDADVTEQQLILQAGLAAYCFGTIYKFAKGQQIFKDTEWLIEP
jgi:hypothetical protein